MNDDVIHMREANFFPDKRPPEWIRRLGDKIAAEAVVNLKREAERRRANYLMAALSPEPLGQASDVTGLPANARPLPATTRPDSQA